MARRVSIFGLLGCSEEEEVVAPPPAANNAPAEQAEQAAAPEADNPLVGTWKIVETEDLANMVEFLEHMSESAPEDRRAELADAIEGLRNAEITFNADAIEMQIGPETKNGSYTIDRHEGNEFTVTISGEGEEPETNTYTLSDDGQTLSVTDDGSTMTFERQR